MKSRVSTASFSMAAFWLAVRITGRCLAAGVAGVAGERSAGEVGLLVLDGLLRLGVGGVGEGCVSGIPVGGRLRGRMSAGGARDGRGDA